ncbi:MAG: flagellar biosynthesis protein FlhF [Myxococcota bacterium]
MQVKTFEAVDMKQALRLVKEELGPNAVIVSSRSVKKDGGVFGLLGRKALEVTAAVEGTEGSSPPDISGARAPRPPAVRGRTSGVYHDLWAVRQAVDPVLDEIRAIRETVNTLDERSEEAPGDLRSDLAQIRTMLSSLVGTGTLGPDPKGAAAQRLFYFLIGRCIDEPLARSLVQRVVARVEAGSIGDLDRLKLNLAAEMRVDLSRAERGAPPSRVQVFIGPTGVGKTTTIAKLAARAERSAPGQVLIITTDVHRVAAVEQMVRFGEILSVPVEVAISPEDLSRALASAQDRERVFVDTTGCRHRDFTSLRHLAAQIEAAGDAEVMLVMSATTRAVDSAEMLEAFSDLPWSRVIMTKLDETRIYGELYNCVVRGGRPIACVTNGQAVPENLESLDTPGILRKVLHG